MVVLLSTMHVCRTITARVTWNLEIPKGEHTLPKQYVEAGRWDTTEENKNNIKYSRSFHPGADYDFRWVNDGETARQQCTYDERHKLITHGMGAGTPDLRSILPLHLLNDMKPFDRLPLVIYLKRWPPNPGRKGGWVPNPCDLNFDNHALPSVFSHVSLPATTVSRALDALP